MATINGTDAGETINGTKGNDTIIGLGGDDVLNGIGGDDTLNGGDGNDLLRPGPTHLNSSGTEQVLNVIANGGSGSDTLDLREEPGVTVDLYGSVYTTERVLDSEEGFYRSVSVHLMTLSSIENVIGSNYDDSIGYSGPSGSKTFTSLISGGNGNDTIVGEAGDTISGDAGNDLLMTAGANVIAHGGDGDDTLHGTFANDLLDGGSGNDTLDASYLTSGVTADLAAGKYSQAGSGTDTLVSIENVTGTRYADTITGDDQANTLIGNRGADTIYGGGGDDTIIEYDMKFKLIDGGTGNDTLQFPSYAAYVYPNKPGPVTIDLAAGTLVASDGTHQLISIENAIADNFPINAGGSNSDPDTAVYALTLLGTSGDNVLAGNGVTTLINGRGGNDTFEDGNVSFAGAPVGVTIDLTKAGPQNTGYGTDTFSQIFNLTGSDHDDALTGGGATTDLRGGLGNDHLGNGIADYSDAPGAIVADLADGTVQDGSGGIDTLSNIFRVIGSAHDDVFSPDTARAGQIELDAGAGTDTLDFAAAGQAVAANLGSAAPQTVGAATLILNGFENAVGSAFNDVLTGDDGVNHLSGGAGKDMLFGGGGNDVLDGGSGANHLDGGYGSDVLIGGDGTNDVLDGGANRSSGDVDTVDFSAIQAAVTVDLTNTAMQMTHQGQMEQILHVQDLVGGDRNDTFTGGDENNVFTGNDGNDTLDGGGGDDVLIGGAGRDYLTGGAGNDRFVFQKPSDSMVGTLRDQIMDFTHGQDKIDLSGLEDYSYGTLTLIGPTAFDHAGQISERMLHGNDVIIDADLDGDGKPDFEIDVKSDHLLVATDFIL